MNILNLDDLLVNEQQERYTSIQKLQNNNQTANEIQEVNSGCRTFNLIEAEEFELHSIPKACNYKNIKEQNELFTLK